MNIFRRVLHCFLVNNDTGMGNLTLGRHIVQYAVLVSSCDNGAMLMLCIHLSACCWQCENLSSKDPSGDKHTLSVRLPMLFSTLGIVWVDIDLPEVITSWGPEEVMLELSTGKPLWSQRQSTK